MASAKHFSDLVRDFSSNRPRRSAGVLARWLSELTSPFGATLTPISPALTGPSASTGSEAMIFMSGSGTASGIITTGSSPGRQRSMLSGEPSEDPKNRLEVLKEKLSRGGAGASATDDALVVSLRSSTGLPTSGLASSDIATSNCGSGGALSAA